MPEGVLRVNKRGAVTLDGVSAKGKPMTYQLGDASLSLEIRQLKYDNPALLAGKPVEYDIEGNIALSVRWVGSERERAAPAHDTRPPAPVETNSTNERSRQTGGPVAAKTVAGTPPQPAQVVAKFHNNYNFIPAPVRSPFSSNDATTDAKRIRNAKSLGDVAESGLAGHDAMCPDRWSGSITVKMTVQSPLLLPDTAAPEGHQRDPEHKVYRTKRRQDGQPDVGARQLRGMIRSAFEQITNSRFGVMDRHDERLFFRQTTDAALQHVPALIAGGSVWLLPGTNLNRATRNARGKWELSPQYAAWLPAYRNGAPDPQRVTYPDGGDPQHGDPVQCLLYLYSLGGVTDYWRVVAIARKSDPAPTAPQYELIDSENHQLKNPIIKKSVTGYVMRTGCNMDKKHFERVFFVYGINRNLPIKASLSPAVSAAWIALLHDYEDIHSQEIADGLVCPPALNYSVWSSFISSPDPAVQNLAKSVYCYASISGTIERPTVEALFPVAISRESYPETPNALIPDTLRPADSLDKLSPADRLFGWSNRDGHGAFKGLVRLSHVACATPHAIEGFEGRFLTLPILGQPKPAQSRFYAAADGMGTPLGDLSERADAYTNDGGIRGRKVYPHHAQDLAYWERLKHGGILIDGGGVRAPQQTPPAFLSNQNRSFKDWVRPGVSFTFQIDVKNLSDVEFGALLFVVDQEESECLRLGYERPLGFGSVHLEVLDGMQIATGAQWRRYYTDLIATEPTTAEAGVRERAKLAFHDAVTLRYGNFDEVAFIRAYRRAVRGFGDELPVRYPRLRPNAIGFVDDDGNKVFDWFKENEAGFKLSLPPLAEDEGLPHAPREPRRPRR